MSPDRDRPTALVDGIGEAGISALRGARILVVGAGGLGSPVLGYLAAAGVGTLGICDDDVVEESNLQRQIIHNSKRLGQVKSASAARSVTDLNPAIRVQIESRLVPDNALRVCSLYDAVVDATDNFATKYLISDTCRELGIPHIWGTLVGMSFQVSVFTDGLTLRDLYPVAPPEGTTVSSATHGVLGAVCGQAGSIMATEVVKLLTGAGTLLCGKLLIVDAGAGKWNVIDFRGVAYSRGKKG